MQQECSSSIPGRDRTRVESYQHLTPKFLEIGRSHPFHISNIFSMLFVVAWQCSQGMHAKERIVTRHIRLWSFLGLFALFIGIACGNPAIAQQAQADPNSQTASRGSISNRLCPV